MTYECIIDLFGRGLIDRAETLKLLRRYGYLKDDAPASKFVAFNRGDWVAFHNTPGSILKTDNPKFDTEGVLLVVYVSLNTTAVEVTDKNGAHGIVDRMNLRHTPFVKS